MTELVQIAVELQEFFESHDLEYCIIGGLAVLRWGEQRATKDVDLTLLTYFDRDEEVANLVLARYKSRISDPVPFARKNRVLLLEHPSGLGIDIGLGGFEYEIAAVQRSSKAEFLPGVFLRTVSAEDLLIMKAFANREMDWRDIRGIMIRQQGLLDWELIDATLPGLVELKEEPEILERLAKLREEFP